MIKSSASAPFPTVLPALRWVLCGMIALSYPSIMSALQSPTRFQVSIDVPDTREPLTGRMLVIVTTDNRREPRLQIGTFLQPPTFAVDVHRLEHGQVATIDESALGYPVHSLADLPPGEYVVQALLNRYTESRRADGRTVWVHHDQWEGQRLSTSPGNLYSEAKTVRLDPAAGFNVRLSLTRAIPPIALKPDTKWLKQVKIQSKLLTEFWGQPVYLGATVLLPKGYDEHPSSRYPVVYKQGHFGQVPFFFNDDPASLPNENFLHGYGLQKGYEFFQDWISDTIPRFISVTIHHPTPYFDDSYGVNSAANGPYDDAIMQELLPYIETRYRIIRQGYARMLEGASTGGWIAMALQLYHPDFYGGAWVYYPDPIDFRSYGLTNLYADTNAFVVSRTPWVSYDRPYRRSREGQPAETVRQKSRLEEVLGTRGRSGGQLSGWESVFAPVDEQGYPKPIWNKVTGTIDKSVVEYMRANNYDLREYSERNWRTLGPKVRGKIHLFVGDMDDFYLNLAVYRYEEFINATDPGAVTFEYGRPSKAHGWHPANFSSVLRDMTRQIMRNAPPGTDFSGWNY